MDASGADKRILLVQTNQVLYDKSAAGYKVKDALEKGDIWQIRVDIAVNSERTTDLRCRFSFLVYRWRCDRSVRFLVSRFSFLVSRFSFLVSRWRCDRAFTEVWYAIVRYRNDACQYCEGYFYTSIIS